MTVHFIGGEMGSCVPSDNNVSESTRAGGFDSAFSRCAIVSFGDTAYTESATFGPLDECWLHFAITDGFGSGGDTDQVIGALHDGTRNAIRVLYDTTTQTLTLQYWNGTSYSSAGSATANIDSARQHVDVYVDGNTASGTLNLYLAGTERITSSPDLSPVSGLETFRSYGRGAVTDSSVSQIVVADESTIGWRVATYYPNAAGANSGWTGGYTTVDETVYSDADFMYSGTAGQVSTFPLAGPDVTGYVVRGIGVYARAKRGSGGPQNLQLVLRVNGTDYTSSSIALGLGYGAHGGIWETNPDTAADWLTTALSSIQAGVKSIA